MLFSLDQLTVWEIAYATVSSIMVSWLFLSGWSLFYSLFLNLHSSHFASSRHAQYRRWSLLHVLVIECSGKHVLDCISLATSAALGNEVQQAVHSGFWLTSLRDFHRFGANLKLCLDIVNVSCIYLTLSAPQSTLPLLTFLVSHSSLSVLWFPCLSKLFPF